MTSPRPALAAASAAPPRSAFILVTAIALALINVTRLHDIVSDITGNLPAGKLALVLAILALIAGGHLAQRIAAFKQRQGLAYLVFVGAMFLSIPLSLYKSDSLKTANDFLLGSGVIAIVTAIAIDSADDVQRLFRTLVIGTVITGAYLLVFGGRVFVGKDGPRTTIPGMYDPNDLALVVAVTVPMAFALLRDRQALWKLIGAAGIVAAVYIIVRTYSRGGFTALAVAVVFAAFRFRQAIPAWFRIGVVVPMAFALLRDRQALWKLIGAAGIVAAIYIIVRTYSRGGFTALAVAVVFAAFRFRQAIPAWFRIGIVVAMVGGLAFAPKKWKDRISTMQTVENDYNLTDKGGRIEIWKRGMGYFVAHPLTGVGLNQFEFAEGNWGKLQGYYAAFKWSAPHNMWVETAAELGLPGILGFIFTWLFSLKDCLLASRLAREGRIDPAVGAAGDALFVATISFMIGGSFVSAALAPICVFIASINIGFGAMLRRSVATAPGQQAHAVAAPLAAGWRSRRRMVPSQQQTAPTYGR